MRTINLFILFSLIIQSCSAQSSEQFETNKEITSAQSITLIDNQDSLSIKGVKEIPKSVFEKPELKFLSVWGQDCDVEGIECFAIHEIPKEIHNLKNLEELHLTLNYISKLPPEILELKKLRILDLTENPNFKDIETVCQMTWLEEFDCFGCHLTDLEVEKLKSSLPNCKLGI